VLCSRIRWRDAATSRRRHDLVTEQGEVSMSEIRERWNELLDLLRDAPDRFAEVGGVAFDDVDVAEGYRYLLHMLRYGVDCMVESDPERPRFVLMADDVTKFYGDNNDGRYFITQISGDRAYRVRGNRGDAVYLSFQSHHGPDRGNPNQLTTDNLNSTRIDFGRDGDFEVVIGGPERASNWLRLDDDATVVILRTYYQDLPHAVRARVEIEPLEPVGAAPPWTTETMAERLQALRNLLAMSLRIGPAPVDQWNTYAEPFQFRVDIPAWGTPDNAYARCYFHLADDEALVVDGEMPACTYMSVQAWNIYTQTLDYRYHCTSRNGTQIALEPDGTFRVVLAATDPGVPNWIDTAGHRIGCLFVRWMLADIVPDTPRATVVPLAELARG
jgi:hypothetical protein